MWLILGSVGPFISWSQKPPQDNGCTDIWTDVDKRPHFKEKGRENIPTPPHRYCPNTDWVCYDKHPAQVSSPWVSRGTQGALGAEDGLMGVTTLWICCRCTKSGTQTWEINLIPQRTLPWAWERGPPCNNVSPVRTEMGRSRSQGRGRSTDRSHED